MSTVTPLRGRDDDLRRVQDVVAAARAGLPVVLVVEGEAGMGKTALLDAALADAVPSEPEVLRLRAQERGTASPFRLFAEAAGTPPPTAPPRGPASSDDGGSLRAEAIAARLEHEGRPSLVVVEDLHWADPGSLLVIERLLLAPDARPPGLIVTTRPAPRRAEVERTLAELAGRGDVIRLVPLTEESALQVLADVTGCPAHPDWPALAARAGGHPFYLVELGRALAASPEAGHRAAGSLHRVVLDRLSRLSGPAREALGLAAVLGPDLYLDDLRRLTRLTPLALDRIARELLDAGVVRVDGPRLTFAHALLHEAVYEDVPEPLRWAHHRELARSMDADGAPLELIAPHLMRGARPGDRAAVDLLVAAARRAMAASSAAALPLWQRAVELIGPEHEIHWEAQAGLVACLVGSGRVEDAERQCLDVLRDAPVDVRPELVGRLVQSRIFQGRWAAARDTLADVVRAAPPGPRARVARAQLALAALQAGDLDDAAGLASAVLLDAAAAGDPVTEVRARAVLAQVLAERGNPTAADREAGQALAAAEVARSAEAWEAQPHSVRVLTLADLDRMDEAIDLAAAGRRLFETLGSEVGQVRIGAAAAYAALGAGRWNGAVPAFEDYRRIAVRRGITPFGFTRSFRATLALAQDGPAAAREWLEDDVVPEPYRDHQWALAHAGLAAAASDPAAGLDRLHTHWRAVTTSGRLLGQRLIGTTLAHLAAEADEPAMVQEVAAALAHQADREPAIASLRAVADVVAALAERDVERMHAAAHALSATPRRYEAARVWSSTAVWSARLGDRSAAREAAHEALSRWLALDARWAAQDLRSTLRREGVVIGSRGGRRRSGTGWAALSPAEERVARLVAEGWSNPRIAEHLVLSRRTVETHVARVLAKLGVGSRTDVLAPDHGESAEHQ